MTHNISKEGLLRISLAQKGRKHKSCEGFRNGHKPFKGTEQTRFKKGNRPWNLGKEHPSAVKHGMCKTNFYRRWISLNSRCNNTQTKAFKDYGGRGIKCEWSCFEDFKDDMYADFLEHSKSYGCLNTTLDRVDNNGNYSAKNCRWTTRSIQMRNRRNNRVIIFNGETMCHQDWATRLGIKWCSLSKRIKKYGVDIALTMKKNIPLGYEV
jgi:hypothetical protein